MTTPVDVLQSDAMQAQALKNIRSLALAGFGLGAGARGLRGLLNLSDRNLRKRHPPLMATRAVSVPLPPDEDEKYAGLVSDVTNWAGSEATDAANWIGNKATDLMDWGTDKIVGPWQGRTSSHRTIPWYFPAAVAGGSAGMYGGWKLTDALLNKRRENEVEDDLDRARKDYEAALRGGSKLASELDRLCDGLEKQAFNSSDLSGVVQGAGLAALGTLGLGAGMYTYNKTKKRRPSEILREAKSRRERARVRRAPLPIYATADMGGAADEDELEGEPLDKVAYDNPLGVPPVPVKTSKPITTPDVLAGGQPAPIDPGSESNHPTGPRK